MTSTPLHRRIERGCFLVLILWLLAACTADVPVGIDSGELDCDTIDAAEYDRPADSQGAPTVEGAIQVVIPNPDRWRTLRQVDAVVDGDTETWLYSDDSGAIRAHVTAERDASGWWVTSSHRCFSD